LFTFSIPVRTLSGKGGGKEEKKTFQSRIQSLGVPGYFDLLRKEKRKKEI